MFQIFINGKLHRTIGIKGQGAMSAIVSLVRGGAAGGRRRSSRDHNKIMLELGGVETGEADSKRSLKWKSSPLHIGDKVLLRVASSSTCSPPDSVEIENPVKEAVRRKRYFEILRKEFGNPGKGKGS